MYAVGVPITIVVDDYLPFQMTMAGWRPILATIGTDNALWGPLIEKAFAKLNGNYTHTVGGWMNYGVSALNGSPYINHWHHDLSKEDLWEFIKSHNDDKNILTYAPYSPNPSGECWEEHPYGL